MATVEFDIDTDLAPEKLREALLDFSERRPELWPDLAPEFYEVYSVGETTADVKEGTVMPGIKVWAREHYDFSRPDRVTWKATESNFCTAGSGMDIEFKEAPGGGSHVHARWERHGTTPLGHFLIALVKLSGGRIISGGMKKNMDRLARESV